MLGWKFVVWISQLKMLKWSKFQEHCPLFLDCDAGYEDPTASGTCMACGIDTYKAAPGTGPCEPCGPTSATDGTTGATSAAQCGKNLIFTAQTPQQYVILEQHFSVLLNRFIPSGATDAACGAN